jgi:hypothetical protein
MQSWVYSHNKISIVLIVKIPLLKQWDFFILIQFNIKSSFFNVY